MDKWSGPPTQETNSTFRLPMLMAKSTLQLVERHIFVLDTTQGGKKIATGTTPSSSWSSPTIADGMLYIGCNDWNIYCFSEGISTQGSTPATTDNVAMGHDIVIVVFVIAALAIAAAFTVSYVNRKKVKTPSTA